MIVLLRPEEINALAAHPSIAPHVWNDGTPHDLACVYDNGGIALGVKGVPGAVIFVPMGEGVYEGHVMFLPEVRGAVAFQAARDIVGWLFTVPGVTAIHGHTPRVNRAALAFARKLGFVPTGTVEVAGIECVSAELTREQWAFLTA